MTNPAIAANGPRKSCPDKDGDKDGDKDVLDGAGIAAVSYLWTKNTYNKA
ncbi:hypothetical protein ACFY05_30375 [Microtetraspora fusca]|uniref:Uncharacterized protein n=1 Tax=Microtetraspora fusca TaxID=1997 RepID=A0ABW6VCU3_MICFU